MTKKAILVSVIGVSALGLMFIPKPGTVEWNCLMGSRECRDLKEASRLTALEIGNRDVSDEEYQRTWNRNYSKAKVQ